MKGEIWADIIIEQNGVVYDYSDKYQISSLGRIRSFKRNSGGKLLKPQLRKDGYLMIVVKDKNKSTGFLIHRLVANAFVENPNNLEQVNHKDENKQNNTANNLEWCSAKYNANYGTRNERASKIRSGKYSGENSPLYGKPKSEEHKKKLKEVARNRTEEHRKNLSNSLKETYKHRKPKNSRKVKCVETGVVFDSIEDAKAWLGKGDIKSYLARRTEYAGRHPQTNEKLHWAYYEE